MGGFAWVTLATNDSYSLGALVLAHSLKQVGTQQQLAVLVTPGVTNPMRVKLAQVFNVVQEVNILDSKDTANLRLLKRPELGITFTKLHCWRLTQFDKCVFLDADTLVLQNCDELFEREELSAAPDVGWPDCFNSGVFVYRPSNDTYEKLIQFALEKGSFDGGDQGLLNLYFSDWAHKDISKHLPFIYNMCSTACYSYLPAYKQFGADAKIIHFIGVTKPWLQYFDTETKTVHPSDEARHIQDVLQRWWDIFCSLIHPNLTPDMTSRQDTVHGSPSNFSRSIPYVPHYEYHHSPTPTPYIPTPAEDYQNVWDPWEEYDLRQSQERPSISNISHVSHSLPIQEQVNVVEIPSQSFEGHTHGNTFEIHAHSEDHNQSFHLPETQSHVIEQSHYIESNQQNQLVESHNTNAYFDAGHDDIHDDQHESVVVDSHNFHPPTPTYSQPQFPPQNDPTPHNVTPSVIHYDPPPPQKSITTEPPPPENSSPRLPDECVATTTVSNEITLYTSTNEDSNDNNSGLAGAFAQLTLGTPRTPEQAALDDHLRRQGWEVGNIDYLGRDSFENIWSKICETLSSGPEQPAQPTPQPKAPSPPVSSEVKPPEQPPPEVISQQKPSPEPEKPQEPEPVKEEPEPIKEEPVVLEKVETQSAEPKTSPEANLPQESATPETESPKPAPEPIIPQPVPESPKPDEPVKSELPQPVEEIATLKSEEASKLAETVSAEPPTAAAPPAENLEIKPPSAAVEESPKPAAEVVPSTPESLPESPKPVAESPVSPTPAPEPVTESPKPPETIPASEAVPESPKLTSEAAPESPKPTSEIFTESPKPTSEIVPESPKPTAEILPESPKPALQVAPESPKAATEAIAAPTPVPESPKPIPDTIAEPPAVASPAPAPETVPASLKSAPEPEKAEPKPAESPKATPQSPKPTPESPKPVPQSPKPEAAPQVCPFAPKSPAEKKPSAKKSSSKEAPQPPKPEVTEATPPTSPVSPQPKQSKQQALVVDTSVPDTPPPASSEASAATPTPPPRKSSGAPKKPSTKTKK